MIPLLEMPDEVAKANFNPTKKIFKLFETRSTSELNEVVVTKQFDGEPASKFGDEIWQFSAYTDAKISSKNKLIFSDIESDILAEECKLVCFAWIYAAGNARKHINVKPSTIISRHSKLMFIYKYLDSKNFQSISQLSKPILFRNFCEHIKEAQFSFGNVGLILNCLSHVERLSSILPIEYSMPPSITKKELKRELCVKTTVDQKNQFYAIPTRIMERLYKHSIDEIEYYHEYREDIHELLVELRENYNTGKKIVDSKIKSGAWSWLTERERDYRVEVNKHKPHNYTDIIDSRFDGHKIDSRIPRKVSDFYGWLAELQINCFIVCAAFTGMRRSEVYCLHPDSFAKKEMFSHIFYTVESTYHKMTQSTGVKAEWVTTPIVQKAIQLAEAISRHLRHQLLMSEKPLERHNASCLWLGQKNKSFMPKIRTEGNMRWQFNKIAKKAALYITSEDLEEFKLINPNCNPLHAERKIQIGELWPITTHQFRRTFAVFAKRHDLCSSIAIKQQFKHLDLHTSEWYGEGGIAAKITSLHLKKELRNLLEEVQVEYKTQKIHHWYNSTERLYGKKGVSIVRERSEIPITYKSWDTIYTHVKEKRLDLVGTLHSYCMAGYECKMNKISSPANCAKCENVLIDSENAQRWKDRHSWCLQTLKELYCLGSLTKSMYSHYITQIKAAERVMKYFKIEFETIPLEIENYVKI